MYVFPTQIHPWHFRACWSQAPRFQTRGAAWACSQSRRPSQHPLGRPLERVRPERKRPPPRRGGRPWEGKVYKGGLLLTDILLPRIARQGTVCLTSTRGRQARKTRIDKFELDEGFQPCHHPPSEGLAARPPPSVIVIIIRRRRRRGRRVLIIMIMIIMAIMFIVLLLIALIVIGASSLGACASSSGSSSGTRPRRRASFLLDIWHISN